MEIFKTADYIKKANPEPGKRFNLQLLENKAENLVGIFVVLPPGGQTPYHFHNKRESVLFVISGKAKQLIEGRKNNIEAGDILFIPAKEKHGIMNDSRGEFRFIEFQVGKPSEPDRVEVEWQET
jgi:quercetin dioxygenase-like cupin family protein